jgi:hypothetical protein
MGVRGTEFVVAIDQTKSGDQKQEKTEITVVHGEVAVSTGNNPPISLVGGKQLVTSNTSAASGSQHGTNGASGAATSSKPEVKSLSSTEMSKVETDSKVEDHTFTQVVTVESSTSSSNGGGSSNTGLANAISVQQTAPAPPPAPSGPAPPVPGGQTTPVIAPPVIVLPPGSTVTTKVVFVR